MNYKIINDEQKLRDFINWLPELEPHETYVINLFARNKYCKDICHINSDKAQMKRFATTKDWMFRKIKQLESEVGTYWQQAIPIPQEALALYITVNPRSQVKAAKNLLVKLADLITKPYNSYNVSAEAMSELQKATSRKIYFDIDIDDEQVLDIKGELKGKINEDAVTFLITKNGLHVLVELNKIAEEYRKTWWNDLNKLPGADVKGSDAMIPVPGCTQGNFTPYFL
jgi:hypothetical protein